MISDKVTRIKTAILAITAAYSSETWWSDSITPNPPVESVATLEQYLDYLDESYIELQDLILEKSEELAGVVSALTLSSDIVLKLNILTVPTDLVASHTKKYEGMNNAYTGSFIESSVLEIEAIAGQGYTSAEELTEAIDQQANNRLSHTQEYTSLYTESDAYSELVNQINAGIASNSTLASTDDNLIISLDTEKSPILTTYNPEFVTTLDLVVPLIGEPAKDKFDILMAQLNTTLDADARILTISNNLTALLLIFT